MFGNNPSIADYAALSNGNDDWWSVIILFFILRNFGGAGDGAYATSADVQRGFDNQSVLNKLNGLENGMCQLGYDNLNQTTQLQQAMMQGNFGLQREITNMGIANMQDTNGLSRQLADCCCENRQGISQLRYDMAADTCAVTTAIQNSTRDIIDNANANYRGMHDELVAIQMQAKDEKIAEQAALIQSLNLSKSQANQNEYLISQLRPTPVPAYTVANPYAGFGYGCCQQPACCN